MLLKTTVVALLWSGFGAALHQDADEPAAPAGEPKCMVFVGNTGDSTDGEARIIKLEVAVDPDNPDATIAWQAAQEAAAAGAEAGAHAQALAKDMIVRKLHMASGDIAAGGPWIGVQFGPVPEALTRQLNLPEGGQMILNVAEGSPADLAGIQQYDVVTQVDGQAVPGDIGEFLEKVRSFAPGETHVFTVIRAGQQVQTNVTIAARPAPEDMPKMKYESTGEELAQRRVFGRGGLMQKDPQGNWVFKGFDSQNLPDFFKALPDVSDLDFNVLVPQGGPDGNHQVFLQKKEGQEIRIERSDDGQITVTRTTEEDDNKNTTTATYANIDEFKAAEPDLAKQFHFLEQGDGAWIFQGVDGTTHQGVWPHGPKGFQFLWNDKLDKDMQAKIEKHMEAMKHLPRVGALLGRPSTRFEVQPNGQIQVITRSGEDELVETFESAAQMQARRPDLHQKYQKIQEGSMQP